MSRLIAWDIETIALPPEARAFARPKEEDIKLGNTKDPDKIAAKVAEALAKWDERAALDPLTGRIALIGVSGQVDIEDADVQYRAMHQDDEAEMLEQFFGLAGELHPGHGDVLIGHNAYGFDLPFVMRRAMILGVDPPGALRGEATLRPSARKMVKDTMYEWTLGQPGEYVKLAHLCGAFGISVKEGPVTGATFGEWWAKDKEVCIEYNRQDCDATYALARRLGYGEWQAE